MQYRNLGNLQQVSAQGLGCMGMSEFYGKIDKEEALAVIHKAYDLGLNFFDTADIYGYGDNEELLGTAIQNIRNQVYIATKCGIIRKKEDPTARGVCGKPEYIKACCIASLKRLAIDHIDLFYLHRIDADTPIEESVSAMAELVKEGKVRYLGLSEASEDIIRRAHKIHPITAIQTEYSLWSRGPENGILATCRELNIGFVPYSPLGRGFLTGKIQDVNSLDNDDFRRNLPRFQADNLQTNLQIVKQLQIMANEKGCSPAQLALAWVLAQGKDIVPIPGTKKIKYLCENLAAIDINLSTADLNQLEQITSLNKAMGARYTAAAMTAYNLND